MNGALRRPELNVKELSLHFHFHSRKAGGGGMILVPFEGQQGTRRAGRGTSAPLGTEDRGVCVRVCVFVSPRNLPHLVLYHIDLTFKYKTLHTRMMAHVYLCVTITIDYFQYCILFSVSVCKMVCSVVRVSGDTRCC